MACSQRDTELQQNAFITCKKCNKKVHWECLDVPANVRSTAKEITDYVSWFCHECQNSSKASTSDEDPESLAPQSWNYSSSTIELETLLTDRCELESAVPNPSQTVDFLKEETATKDIRRSQVEKLKRRYGTMEAWTPTILGHFSLKDYFVRLEIEELESEGKISEQSLEGRILCELSDIFGNKEGCRNILITGDAGCGKTTLARKLCYDWSTLHSRDNYMSQFDIVLNIPLERFFSFSIDVAIQHELFSGNEKGEMANVLEGQRILLILDGLDEIIIVRDVVYFLANPLSAMKEFTRDLTILATSRPFAIRDHCRLFDRHLSIIGFLEQSQKQYINNVLLVEESVNSLIDRINSSSFLQKASQCPLLLHLICCVHETGNSADIHSRIELFSEIFKLLAHCGKKKGKSDIGKLLLEKIDEDEFFIRLGKFVFSYIYNYPKYYSRRILKKEFEELEFLLGLGILVAIPTVGIESTVHKEYRFVHSTFAEFLSSIYIAHFLRTRNCTIIDGVPLKDVIDTTLIFILSWLDKNMQKVKPILHDLANNRNLSELIEIYNEGCLSQKSWEEFSSSVTKMWFNWCYRDRGLLSFKINFPNLRIIKIVAEDSRESLVKINDILNRWETINFIFITINVDVSAYNADSGLHGIGFISMEGLVTKLTDLNKSFPNLRRIQVFLFNSKHTAKRTAAKMVSRTTCHLSKENPYFIAALAVAERDMPILPTKSGPIRIIEGSVIKRKHTIGLLPESIGRYNFRTGTEHFYKWRIFRNINTDVFYIPNTHEVEAVPFLLITPDEYATIANSKALHLRAICFKKSEVHDIEEMHDTEVATLSEFLVRALMMILKLRILDTSRHIINDMSNVTSRRDICDTLLTADLTELHIADLGYYE